MKSIIQFFFSLVGICCITSCNHCTQLVIDSTVFSTKESIYCVTYNAQTFFDAIEDGREFSEFKGNKTKWSAETYKKRLERLRQVGEISVETLGGGKNRMPDIFVIQEIESERVIEDFAKLFSEGEGYKNAVFFPPTGSGNFSTAIFSKFPVISYEQFKLTNTRFSTSGLRPLVKATVEINLGNTKQHITIFGIHWKSKKGDNTEVVRKAQQEQLLKQVKAVFADDKDAYVLICGDFNQQGAEFDPMENLQDVWQLEVPTYSFYGIQGSYYYNESWEDIDHIFFSHNLRDGNALELVDFAPVAVKPLIRDNGRPNEFRLQNGGGYSDHLPLCAVLSFIE